jgi:hypothetical protein
MDAMPLVARPIRRRRCHVCVLQQPLQLLGGHACVRGHLPGRSPARSLTEVIIDNEDSAHPRIMPAPATDPAVLTRYWREARADVRPAERAMA